MKKLLFGLCLSLISVAGFSQVMENLIVEEYYTVTQADVDAAAAVGETIELGAKTWRFYVDLAAGTTLQAIYGNPTHELRIETQNQMFNHLDRGGFIPSYSKTTAAQNVVMLDSWVSVGAGAAGNWAVMLSEDNGLVPVTHPAGVLSTLTPNDGLLISGTVPPLSNTGMDAQIALFHDVPGTLVSVNGGSWYNPNGVTGPTATNRVCIAQITVKGWVKYEFNIQVGTATPGVSSKYVSKNPIGSEVLASFMSGEVGGIDEAPAVSVSAPIAGSQVRFSTPFDFEAIATDDKGISSVEFFVDGASVGTDNSFPYSISTSISGLGSHALTAVAYDSKLPVAQSTTSAPVNITVVGNAKPVVVLDPIVAAPYIAGDVLAISATATDDISVSSVEFFVDGVSVGVDATLPYEASYTMVAGNHIISARATDNEILLGDLVSLPSFLVVVNTAPTTSFVSPANGFNVNINTLVTFTATASDVNGDATITSVAFDYEGVVIPATFAAGVWSADYTFTAEDANAVISVSATDSKGAVTAIPASISITVNDPNALPYAIEETTIKCLDPMVCMPVITKKAISGINGYDVVLTYDKNKVIPTGNITVYPATIDPSLVDVTVNNDTANSELNVVLSLKTSAPASTNFNGIALDRIFCAEFAKRDFASYDTTVIVIDTLIESYVNGDVAKGRLANSGMFITYKDSVFTAKLVYWSNGEAIQYDAVNPNDHLITTIHGDLFPVSPSNTVVPDLSGNFVYNLWNGTNININRDIDNGSPVNSMITGQDAYEVNQLAVRNPSVVPSSVFQVIAADVNTDGIVSAGDASQIAQRSTLTLGEFNQAWNVAKTAPSKDWFFANTPTLAQPLYSISATFPQNNGIGFSKYRVPQVSFFQSVPVTGFGYAVYGDCPLIGTDTYKGVMVGDVNQTYATIASNPLLKSSEEKAEIVIDFAKATTKGNEITVPVSIDADNITSVTFDAISSLKLVNVRSTNENFLVSFNANYSENGGFAIASYSAIEEGVSGENVILLTFSKSNSKSNSEELKAGLVAYYGVYGQGEIATTLKVGSALLSVSNSNIVSVKVYPSPAAEVLNVEASENAKVQIISNTGAVVAQSEVSANQVNAIDVTKLSSGIYSVKVYSDNFVEVKKVVIK